MWTRALRGLLGPHHPGDDQAGSLRKCAEGGVKPGTGRCPQAERRLTASAPAFSEPRARETTEWLQLEFCG